jgi:hypothetical protein
MKQAQQKAKTLEELALQWDPTQVPPTQSLMNPLNHPCM